MLPCVILIAIIMSKPSINIFCSTIMIEIELVMTKIIIITK